MKQLAQGLLLAMGMLGGGAAGAVDVGAYVKKDSFEDIELSPTGEFIAATVPLEDRTVLTIIRRSDNKVTANFALGKNTHVGAFSWVSDDRVLISVSEKFGALDEPQFTGELFAISADGSKPENLVGFRVASATYSTNIKPKKAEEVAAYLVDDLPAEDRAVIVAVQPFAKEPYTRVERLDVYSGRRTNISTAPVRNASYFTDHRGVVRFAFGVGMDNSRKLYYRAKDGAEWKLISDDSATGLSEWPVGFSADDQIAYLEIEQRNGPNVLATYDPVSGARATVLADATADPGRIIYRANSKVPVGAVFAAGKPKLAFLDQASEEAKLYRSLEAAFDGNVVEITSSTRDGRLVIVHVTSDRNPGDFYLFDTQLKKADFLLSSRDWFDPDSLNSVQPVQITARDGMPLHGFLTVPHGSDGKKLPMIVLPHGGPFGVQDAWTFDEQSQLLASAGYAVLRVNFRGSGGFGRAFKTAGAREWGGAMQDDLTDATKWAISRGVADPGRICIYGASYGAYAALMGVAKEPDLYRCAAGYVGVYDLPVMVKEDARYSRRLASHQADWVGQPEQLAESSPNRIAARIKAPVFLAAGGEDIIAPVEHTRMMEKALRGAGTPVEALYYDTEGHGFYKQANRTEYYTRLLAFFSRHLGGKAAGAASAAGGK